MPILTKEVEVMPMGKAIQHYRDKGYDAKHKQPLIVKTEDLPRGSDTKIDVLCDMCHKNKMTVKYGAYNRVIESTGSYVCKKCSIKKVEQTNLKKYGVPYITQLETIKEKTRQTNLEKYGVLYPTQLKSVKEKVKQTNLKRYGVESYSETEEYRKRVKQTNLERYGAESYAQTKECQAKMKYTTENKYGVSNYSQTQEYKEKFHNTCVIKYGESYRQQFAEKARVSFYNKTGYDFLLQSPEIKEKVKKTWLSHYGVDNPNKSPKVREKTSQTLYANSSQKASRQQRYICELYQGILNYPIKYYNVDIYLSDDNLVIEYDGGGHMLNVVMGRQTIEEYTQKEIIRNNVLKREGYKQIKIISSKDLLPSDQILLQMLNDAKQYFSSTNHSWINFDIDNSKMINVENKNINGVFYEYGDLRTIKEIA